jgi:drug/metabolite transporter (DMT)-like permease
LTAAAADAAMSNQRTQEHDRRTRALGVGAVALAAIGLSLGSTMVKSSGSPGPVVAFWRLFIGSFLWMLVLAVTRTSFSKKDFRTTAPLGVLFGVNLCFFFTAARLTRVAHAEFIGTLTPVIIVPFAARRYKEKVSRLVIVCGSIALCGVAFILLSSAKGSTNWLGNLMALGAVITWAIYLIISRTVRTRVNTLRFMTGMTIAAAVTALPFAASTHRLFDVSTKGWVLIGVMAVSSGMVCHGLYAWSQRVVPLSTIGLMQLAQPGLSTMWARIFLHETVRPLQVLGMAVVLIAVAFIAVRAATGGSGPVPIEPEPL